VNAATVKVGTWFFRWRSYTPIPVIAILLGVVFTCPAQQDTGNLGTQVLTALGIALAIVGEAVRFLTLGQVPEGTSGQGTRLEASALNTQGPYAHVRNPLYLGNLGICLGLLLIAHRAWAYAIGISFFLLQYFFIIRAEESFLQEQYGGRFQRYTELVPRWIPRLTPAYPGRVREHFDFARALKKEHNPATAWISGLVALVGWNLYCAAGLTRGRIAVLLSVEAVVLASFAIVKAYKRGWLRAL